jgi:hypothetical protein
MTKFYLDDYRDPDETYHDTKNVDWVVVRSYADAVDWVRANGIPEFISFDHDLGTDESGDTFAKFLIDSHLDGTHKFPVNFDFKVHSANPVGAANIEKRIVNFLIWELDNRSPAV